MYAERGVDRIEVIVKKVTDGADPSGTKEKTDVTTESIATSDTAPSTSFSKRFLRTNITHGIAVARQTTLLGINYWQTGIGNRTGDQSLQDMVQRNWEIAEDVTGFASNVAIGATYGAAGGPLGIALGAVFGAVSSAVSLGVKYAGRERDFNYKVFKENNAIEYQRARASINMTSGRLR